MTEFQLSRVTRENSTHLWDVASDPEKWGETEPQFNPENYLGLVWRFAAGVDLRRVLLTTTPSNEASIRVILGNGGIETLRCSIPNSTLSAVAAPPGARGDPL